MSVATGMAVMQAMLDAEVTAACGPKGRHDPDRTATRHCSGKGSVVLGGRRVPVVRPRARTADGHEVALPTYQRFTSEDQLSQVVMERMLAGVATRRHTAAAEPVGSAVAQAAPATSRSAVSRRFVAQARTALRELLSRDLGGMDVKVLMVDGEHLGERCCVVALAIAEHLPEAERGWVDAKLVRALATALERNHPGAAASLREGMEQLFTVARLGITGTLAKTLTTSNPIESMISIARTTNRNVTRWRDGQMVLRWTAAGMLNAQRSFRRVKGYKQMPQLVAALHRHAHPSSAHSTETVSTAA